MKGKKLIVYDCEVLPNFACVVVTELIGDMTFTYEISEHNQDHAAIIQVAKLYQLIGYNSHSYDDIITKYVMLNPKCTNAELYEISRAIIDRDFFVTKKYKQDKSMQSIDIMTMLASSKLRVSLKHLQVVIKWHNVQEFEVEWTEDLPEDRWEACKEYCVNDVLSLKAVCQTLEKEFKLRDFVYETTGLLCYSKDPVKIAEYTMADAIAKDFPGGVDQFIWDTVDANVPVKSIHVSELILPFVQFKTPRFKAALKTYQDFILEPEKEQLKKKSEKFKVVIRLENMFLNLGLGGIHHEYKRGITHKEVPGTKLLMPDVSSYYPSMRIEHFPHRFDPLFLTEYKKAYAEKAEGKRTKNKMLEGYAKLKLNSVFGLYNSVYSPLYSPTVAYSTTINGQLMLCMLIEEFLLADIEVLGTNTDSITVRVKDAQMKVYHKICAEWEKTTSMGLDHDEFTAIYEQSCNNYIAMTKEGYAKTKGTFVPELNLLKGYTYPVIKNAMIDYFTKGVPIEKTIRDCKDIYDFCMSTRMGVSKDGVRFEAYHNGKKLQRTNRYYASVGPGTAYMYKSAGGPMQHVLKGSGVIVFNKYVEKDDYNINYKFYIREAMKAVRAIEPEQLGLW